MAAAAFGNSVMTTLWGLFCACSWTWCIGMYLPVILFDRYGWPGFIAFAVPNVLGCAGMGYVVKTRERGIALMHQHGRAMLWFSAVTIAFHMWFLSWLGGGALAHVASFEGLSVLLPLAVYALALLAATGSNHLWLALTVVIYAASLAAFSQVGFDANERLAWSGRLSAVELWWLVPVLMVGFLTCPYLDLTFHRALQCSPSRHAFAVFGATFFVMIFLTGYFWFAQTGEAEIWIFAHVVSQSIFTVGAHVRELLRSAAVRSTAAHWSFMLLPLVGIAVWHATMQAADGSDSLLANVMGPDAQERNYLRWLVFYGLAFPAYVGWVMWPGARPTRGRIAALFAGALLLAPMYELGVIGRYAWLGTIAAALVAIIACACRFRSAQRAAAEA